MKSCPFCAESMPETAIKCKHCGKLNNYKSLEDNCVFFVNENYSFPLQAGSVQFFEDHFEYKGNNLSYECVKHLESQHFKQTWGPNYSPLLSLNDNSFAKIITKNGDIIKFSAKSALGINKSKVYNFKKAVEYLQLRTFDIRLGSYVESIENNKFFIYDGTIFYLDGTIDTRKGNRISFHDYQLKSGDGPFLRFVKKNENKTLQIFKKIARRHPNSGYWTNALHGERTISTSTDSDVFFKIMRELYS